MRLHNLLPNIAGTLFSHDLIQADNYRYYFASQQIFLAALLLHSLFLILFIWLNVPELIYFNIVSIGIFSVSLDNNRKGKHLIAIWLTYFEVNAHATLAVSLLGWNTGFYYYLLAIGPMLFFYPHLSVLWKTISALVSAFLLALLYILSHAKPLPYELTDTVALNIYIFNMVSTFGLLAYLAYYYSHGADESEAKLKKLSAQFEQLSIRDPLTGLLNRRAMDSQFEAIISRFHRHQQPFTLVIGDIDNFKSCNDRFGHQAGDDIIRHVASIMLENTRTYDVISRWGGEEFLLILPDCRLYDAQLRIDHLRNIIQQQSITYKQHKIAVTLTFGICEFNTDMSIDDCLELADQALYRGKHSGKNRVEITDIPAAQD